MTSAEIATEMNCDVCHGPISVERMTKMRRGTCSLRCTKRANYLKHAPRLSAEFKKKHRDSLNRGPCPGCGTIEWKTVRSDALFCSKLCGALFRAKKRAREMPEAVRETARKCYEAHKEQRLANMRSYREKMGYTERELVRLKQWRVENPGKYRAAIQRYRLRKSHAMPSWLCDNEREIISTFYETAADMTRFTKTKYEVDHFFPLRGRGVCGLHVAANLQVVPRSTNRQKGNKVITSIIQYAA